MLDYKLVQACAEVIHFGSFEKAARALGLTQSAISQRVKLLEERLGQPLIVRAKPIAATAAGQRLLAHYQSVRLLEQDLGSELPDVQPESGFGQVTLAVNADSLATWFVDVPKRLFEKLGLLVHLLVDDESLNHQSLQEGNVLGAVSLRDTPIQGCRVRPLGFMRYFMVVSPEFQERYFKDGVTADALRACPAVNFSEHDELQNQFLNQYFGLNPGEFPAHTVPSSQGFVTLAEQGVAYAVVEQHQAEAGLRNGKLVRPCPFEIDRPLYWHHKTINSRLLDQVNEIVLAEARRHLPEIGM
ncbi:LysR family transcriptional regulator ArgP [Thalassospira sp.]|uniref:LysR family transcriptional regulator ArgP n=1 Tax=Thalassospira sp. TaxID=1912094 RepID=UPI000C580221|nr:LysR family transcriptional regulator ArgP [Thalassospira sp.]MBC07939.1 transcriptional regulator ArgP [Thalassospira sp.]|tara:strand:- start:170 stop:1069 length:900 start_codon:yes stop_codon:yes gene_type:complete